MFTSRHSISHDQRSPRHPHGTEARQQAEHKRRQKLIGSADRSAHPAAHQTGKFHYISAPGAEIIPKTSYRQTGAPASCCSRTTSAPPASAITSPRERSRFASPSIAWIPKSQVHRSERQPHLTFAAVLRDDLRLHLKRPDVAHRSAGAWFVTMSSAAHHPGRASRLSEPHLGGMFHGAGAAVHPPSSSHCEKPIPGDHTQLAAPLAVSPLNVPGIS